MIVRKIGIALTPFLVLLCVVPTLFASPAPAKKHTTFFQEDREGWFWYQKNNATEKNATKPITPPVADQKSEEEKEFDGFKDIDWNEVWTLHPDKFQALITDTQKWAIQDPSVDRLKIYIALQKVAKERAVKFQQVWGETLNQNPLLDELKRSPTKVGSLIEAHLSRQDKEKYLKPMRENMGILYFYSSTCAYCDKQKKILEYFIDKWGWENITAINTETEVDAVLEYGVDIVPDMWVVGHFNGEIRKRRIGAGLLTVGDIEKGLMNAWSYWTRDKPYEVPETIEQLQPFEKFLENMSSDGKNDIPKM
jgi:conjugal transfer pilus assembly protein TraF